MDVWNMCCGRRSLVFILLFGLWGTIRADVAPTYVFDDSAAAEKKLSLDDYVRFLVDVDGTTTIGEVLTDGELPFVSATHLSLQHPFYNLWYRVQIKNATNQYVKRIAFVSMYITEGDVYIVEDDKVIDQQRTGSYIPSLEKPVYSRYNYVEILLPPGSTRTIYLRTNRGTGFLSCCPTFMDVVPPSSNRKSLAHSIARRYFFLGAMLLVAIVSFFSAYLFRRWVFVWFGVLMFFFGFYFLFIAGGGAILFSNGTSINITSHVRFTVSGVMLAMFLFVKEYLRLPTIARPMYYMYAGVTALVVLMGGYSVFANLQGRDTLFSYLYSGTMLVYMFVTVFVVFRLALKKDTAARSLLTSLMILFSGALVGLLNSLNLLPFSFITSNAFRISTLFFAGIIFRELLEGVSALRAQKEELSRSNFLKSRFFANITHEFRTPLTLMLAPLRQAMSQSREPENLALLRLAERNAERQLDLVDQLLDLSRLDTQAMVLSAVSTDLNAYLRRTLAAYESLAESQEITMKIDLPAAPLTAWVDADKLDRVLLNLLSNAFKFTPGGGTISVAGTQDAKEVVIAVEDTGRGIPPELLPNIFDRFFFAGNEDAEVRGSGIGLALVREMVQLHHGTVSVASRVGEGTTFTIRLPRGKEHLSAEEMAPPGRQPDKKVVIDPALLQPTVLADASAPNVRASLPRVLLVEDNDEMRAFILQMLAPHYCVETAPDGSAGVEAALNDPPDLIISDLMMPKKDGYALCRELKTDLRTSHVPVILLTARASTDARLAGLDEGADDYLTKPFDARELLARAANLIRSRRLLRERFAKSITAEPAAAVQPAQFTVSKLDKAFLSSALAFIEQHLDDPDLSVDSLATEVGMGRTQLNIKLRALVDKSTNQFIQSVRLKRAAAMLRQPGVSAKEVAYDCGFSSPAYFARVFKKEFGETPGTFGKDKSNHIR